MQDTATLDIDKVLDKLTKIQELIDRGATAGEVAAAAGRMQHLLTKHGLTIELVKMRKGEERHLPEQFYIPVTSAGWLQTLAAVLAQANYGKAIHTWRDHQQVIAIVCHAEDWAVIKNLFDKFSQLIEKMAPTAYEQYKVERLASYQERYPDSDPRWCRFESKRTWCNAWRLGCVGGIHTALMQARRDAEAQVEGSSALVVIKDAAVAERYRELYPHVVARRRSSANSTSGYSAGYNTGKSLGRGTSIAG